MKKTTTPSGIPKVNLAIITLIGFAISFLINLSKFLAFIDPELSFFEESDIGVLPVYIYRLLSFTVYCSLIIYINASSYLDIKLSKLNNYLKTVVKGVINATICFFTFLLFFYINDVLIHKVSAHEVTGLRFIWIFMLLLCILIAAIIKLRLKQHAVELEKEQLLKYNIQNELKALHNQLDPHFLFNSLNSLNYVIKNLPNEATNYVDKLSVIYRYILESKNRDTVSVKEELDYLSNYNDLMRFRYGDNFKVSIDLSPEVLEIQIPILALQILVENAIKHNEISKEFPLLISIYNTSNAIVVENKIQNKLSPVNSSKEGLLNLSKRYRLLKGRQVGIRNDLFFQVKLPY